MIEKIEKEAKKYFVGSDGCHDWSHVERVRKLALMIGKKEKADLFVLEIASLLHDIKRKEEIDSKGSFCHATEGEKEGRMILDKYNISDKQKKNICHCIRTHRFRNNDQPKTIEAKVLFDADKLDSIGAVGLGRAFLFAGSVGSCKMYTNKEKEIAKLDKDMTFKEGDSAILEYEVKLKKIKNMMMTKAGKEIAKDRHNYMVEFIKRFWLEVKGKK